MANYMNGEYEINFSAEDAFTIKVKFKLDKDLKESYNELEIL